MNIGIIVYSQTGHTLQVAEQLRVSLADAGHEATLAQVRAVTEDPRNPMNVRLTEVPDPSGYDMLYIAAPVHGFSLCPAMKSYLQGIAPLDGKKVACFVTQHFPYPWMGGNRAVRQMSEAIGQKGGHVIVTGVVNWSHKDRPAQINRVVGAMTTASPVRM